MLRYVRYPHLVGLSAASSFFLDDFDRRMAASRAVCLQPFGRPGCIVKPCHPPLVSFSPHLATMVQVGGCSLKLQLTARTSLGEVAKCIKADESPSIFSPPASPASPAPLIFACLHSFRQSRRSTTKLRVFLFISQQWLLQSSVPLSCHCSGCPWYALVTVIKGCSLADVT